MDKKQIHIDIKVISKAKVPIGIKEENMINYYNDDCNNSRLKMVCFKQIRRRLRYVPLNLLMQQKVLFELGSEEFDNDYMEIYRRAKQSNKPIK